MMSDESDSAGRDRDVASESRAAAAATADDAATRLGISAAEILEVAADLEVAAELEVSPGELELSPGLIIEWAEDAILTKNLEGIILTGTPLRNGSTATRRTRRWGNRLRCSYPMGSSASLPGS